MLQFHAQHCPYAKQGPYEEPAEHFTIAGVLTTARQSHTSLAEHESSAASLIVLTGMGHL